MGNRHRLSRAREYALHPGGGLPGQGYLLFFSLTIFLSAMTRVKQSGQANRTPLVGLRDNGRIVAASTRRLHSGHRLIFDGSLPIKSKFPINTVSSPRERTWAARGVPVSLLLISLLCSPRAAERRVLKGGGSCPRRSARV